MKKGKHLNINNKILSLINGSYLVYEETITENLLIRSEESGTLVFAGKNNRKGGLMTARSVRTPESESSAGKTPG